MRRRPSRMGRVFVVGCPRSGTTLVQSLLYAHPDVMSFPETFFFLHAVGGRTRRQRALGLPSHRIHRSIETLEQIGLASPARTQPKRLASHVRRFTKALDDVAVGAGKSMWIEKTPKHLHRIEDIRRHVKGAKFVHVLRSGAAVVASLYEVTHSYPDDWGGPRGVDECVERWRGDVLRSLEYVGKPNHAFVSYERLATEPRSVLEALVRFLGLRVDDDLLDAMLERYGAGSSDVVRAEPWKTDVNGRIANRNGRKLEKHFSADERRRIEAALAAEETALERFPFLGGDEAANAPSPSLAWTR